MKLLKYILLLGVVVGCASCSDDHLETQTIFETEETTSNELDAWIVDNYTTPFNIRFNYRYEDIESDRRYNLVPADYEKSVALAKIIKFLWLDAYVEVNADANPTFMQTYCPKVIQLIGSAAWEDDGSRILGQAEGGLKITLYEVNAIDLDNISVEAMNELWFHTMHHEFSHILHQTKIYSPDFKLITGDKYNSSGWTNVEEEEARHWGFVTSYGSSEPNEDFVEIISMYLTHDQAWWEAVLAQAKQKEISEELYQQYATGQEVMPDDDASLKTETETVVTPSTEEGVEDTTEEITRYYLYYGGDEKILEKFAIITKYFETSWGFELPVLREIVQRRSGELGSLDLNSL